MRCQHGYLSVTTCKWLACGSADATARWYIFPPHLISVSALPCETENTKITSFHLNVVCRFTSRHKKCDFHVSSFARQCSSTNQVRQENIPPRNCLFSTKYLCQKLLKSNNVCLSYSKKCWGLFSETQCTYRASIASHGNKSKKHSQQQQCQY